MLEKALQGSKSYWTWVAFLLVLVGVGGLMYLIMQYQEGLMVTGMSRDVSWGFYIAQFTFLVGVAASAVMLVVPKYLHHYQTFGRITILGEFLAIAAVTMCVLFILVDLGKPERVMNVILHPTPNSILFWDMVVLNGYLAINLVVGWAALSAERKSVEPPKWIKPLIYLSVPWAVSIHTVTAFLYAGLPGRHFWLTAIMAPRFLASAFAAGPALLVILAMLVKKLTRFDAGREAFSTLSKIITYAICLNVFFFALEWFTAGYSNIPSHIQHLEYLFFGLTDHATGVWHGTYVPWMWSAYVLMLGAIVLLLVPKWRENHTILTIACIMVFFGTWIDKGMGMISGGFVPNPLHQVHEYIPSRPELLIALGVWALGFLILTILYKVALGVKQEVEVEG
jgi:molybdopterin-containing oxidoreductase family membrane subunit